MRASDGMELNSCIRQERTGETEQRPGEGEWGQASEIATMLGRRDRQSGKTITGTESKSMPLCWDWAVNQQQGATASSCVQEGGITKLG